MIVATFLIAVLPDLSWPVVQHFGIQILSVFVGATRGAVQAGLLS